VPGELSARDLIGEGSDAAPDERLARTNGLEASSIGPLRSHAL